MTVGVRRRCLFLFILLVISPYTVRAQVVISEFMYDAPGSDSGEEWVELFNAGTTAVDLTKWKINDGSNHILNVPPQNGGTGSITLSSGAYIVLADNATNFEGAHAGIANVIDTTLSLPNTSGTVSLVDDSGVVVDALSYTKDTGAAGDGNSLQRSEVSGTAIRPGTPTPGTGPLSTTTGGASASDASTTVSTPAAHTTIASPVSSYVPPPSPSLFADAGDDRTVIVGADTQFDARAYDRNEETVDTARFLWNFGDGSTAEGESVLHHYSYPGRYALVLNIAQEKFAATDEAVITAEPAKLGFSVLPNGGVAIQNLAGRDLDLSGWIIRAGPGLLPALFMLPPHSVILSDAAMHITRTVLGFTATEHAELQYPNGVSALEAGHTTTPASAAAVPQPPAAPTPARAPASVYVAPTIAQDVVVAEDSPATSSELAAAGVTTPSTHVSLWWVAAAVLALLSGGSLVVARHLGRKEWNIIEEMPE